MSIHSQYTVHFSITSWLIKKWANLELLLTTLSQQEDGLPRLLIQIITRKCTLCMPYCHYLLYEIKPYQVRVSHNSAAFISDILKIGQLVQKSKRGHEYTDISHGNQFLGNNLQLLQQTSRCFGTKRAHWKINT